MVVGERGRRGAVSTRRRSEEIGGAPHCLSAVAERGCKVTGGGATPTPVEVVFSEGLLGGGRGIVHTVVAHGYHLEVVSPLSEYDGRARRTTPGLTGRLEGGQ